ncbi:Glycosyltransferase involved in cell wall bisynthesis [Mucilaginibacter sp. OK268]|uniref:glycosyltransferase n=1 Tax=Mucilaginibacter sp. OK268 TaxID=1881048 RepID=UPI000887F31B|nr:glycosyltransferase [Mucilaginibacter sp. OK268]SDP56694.1 Glycosyltransferase involved in cell wall bisynthesis [Mucilaginibacter sp. OK268]
MKVLMISGSYPPELCGIGDYSEKLVNTLKRYDIEVSVLANIDWSVKNYFSIIRQIESVNADVIHMQYPSFGYGFSIVPQMLSLKYKTVITIHEVSKAHPIRQLSLLPFSLRGKLIFTNSFEKDAFKRIYPFRKKRIEIIPIGSNIKISEQIARENKRYQDVIYFGQIRPEKGIEKLISLAEMFRDSNLSYKVVIAGQLLKGNQKYLDDLQSRSSLLPITWLINLSENEVGSLLANNLLAYLPFPDGVSERRGSFFAALANNMLVFTTKGEQSTAEMEETVYIIPEPQDLFRFLNNISIETLLQLSNEKNTAAQNYIKKMDWDVIAQKHMSAYKSL